MSQGKLTSSLLFGLVAAATACVETSEDLATEAQALGGCSSWGCNMNSPVIDVWNFHELDENGAANDAGVRLLRLMQGGNAYRVNVVGAKLYAIPYGSGATLTGSALINSYMEVATPDGELYRIYIKNVSNVVKYWVGPATTIETYELAYTNQSVPTDVRPLCTNPPGRLDGEGQYWLKRYESILYTGDRYDADRLDVTAASYGTSGGWFNIACAGGALAKLHLNRHTTAGQTGAYQSTLGARQTMLKMYTADVCGTGNASTKQGEPLVWENKYGWQTLPPSVSSLEALWDENGAICLEHHRLEADPVWWPLIQPEIVSACGGASNVPPPCSVAFPGGVMSFPGGGYIVTANP